VQGRANRRRGPHDALPLDGETRPPAGHDHHREAGMSPTPLGGRGRNQPGPAANTNAGDPLARISNPEIQRAARRLAARTVGSETIPSEYEGDAVLEIASLAAELDALVSGREPGRSEEHTSELSHVKISYAVFCL